MEGLSTVALEVLSSPSSLVRYLSESCWHLLSSQPREETGGQNAGTSSRLHLLGNWVRIQSALKQITNSPSAVFEFRTVPYSLMSGTVCLMALEIPDTPLPWCHCPSK